MKSAVGRRTFLKGLVHLSFLLKYKPAPPTESSSCDHFCTFVSSWNRKALSGINTVMLMWLLWRWEGSQVIQKQCSFVISLALTGKIPWFWMQCVVLKYSNLGNLEQLLVLCVFVFEFVLVWFFLILFPFRDLDDCGKYFSQKIEQSSLGRLQLGLKIQHSWFHMFMS